MGIVSLGIFDEVALVSFCEVFWALLLDILEVEVDLVLECEVLLEDKVRVWDFLVVLVIILAFFLIWDLVFVMLGLEIVFFGGLLIVDIGVDLVGFVDRFFWSWGLGKFVFIFFMELVRFNDFDFFLVFGVFFDFVLGWIVFIGIVNFFEVYEIE